MKLEWNDRADILGKVHRGLVKQLVDHGYSNSAKRGQGSPGVDTLTWDRGKELSAHAAFRVETGIPVYFADPHSPWQRGTNENTNGLLRQYFPKGTDLNIYSAEHLRSVENEINHRPRAILDDHTPAELFTALLTSPDHSPLRR